MIDVDDSRLNVYGWAPHSAGWRRRGVPSEPWLPPRRDWNISKSKKDAVSDLVSHVETNTDGDLSADPVGPMGDAVDIALGWLCRAYKVMPSDLLTSEAVEKLIESIDYEAGGLDNVGSDESFFKSAGPNSWQVHILASRRKIGQALDELWHPMLWYHEVEIVAPVRGRVGSLAGGLAPMPGELVRSADPNESHRIMKQWNIYSHVEPISADKVLLATQDKAYIEVSRQKKLLTIAVGEWGRIGDGST